MVESKITRPESFSSEEEEADWWYANPDYILQEFDRAKTEGRLGNGIVRRRMAAVEAAKAAALKLDPTDLTLATRLADEKGVDRDSYLKDLLHTALLKEAEALDQSSAA